MGNRLCIAPGEKPGEICGKPLQPKQKYYCSKECYIRAKKKRQTEELRDLMKEGRSVPREKRTCLRCREPFLSFGRHNQICPKCNAINNAWMAGKSEKYIYHAALRWDDDEP